MGWIWIILTDNSSIHTSGITLFFSWLWFSSDSTLDCICRTGFSASATADTFRTVGVFHRVYYHLACFCTFSAFYTLIFIHSILIQRHRIKDGIKRSQRTDIFAERTVDQNGENDCYDKDHILPYVQPAQCTAHGFIQKYQRQSALQCSCRAD